MSQERAPYLTDAEADAQDLSNAPRLTDAEAKTALFLLAKPLEWLSKAGGAVEIAESLEPFQYVICAGRQGLTVRYAAGHAPKYLDENLPTEYAPRLFDTIATAKAACERHHATGKWD